MKQLAKTTAMTLLLGSLSSFNQAALDQMAWQGYGNANFEVGGDDRWDIVKEHYEEDNVSLPIEGHTAFNFQQGLQRSVTTLN